MVKILVIDDDQDILDFIQSGLEHVHSITTALNGEQGLRECEHGAFDLILTDIFMPFRDGLDIIREVTKRYPSSKTIAMTGQYGDGQTDYLKAAQAFGAAKTLQKPFTIEQLLEIVDEALKA